MNHHWDIIHCWMKFHLYFIRTSHIYKMYWVMEIVVFDQLVALRPSTIVRRVIEFIRRLYKIVTSLSFFTKTKSAPTKHLMLMLEIGVLIANKFGPREFQNHRVLTFALVYANHYVMVQLEGEYPMPPIASLWIRHKAPSTTQ
uniref:Uncharacterized protein n=1 Tax=Lactuca sativa TaxID=4236 RepID=A0A9R1WSJ3_LACSA|nr:hypothetical protein LSAT_V11C100040440 [Lactuca sativa]